MRNHGILVETRQMTFHLVKQGPLASARRLTLILRSGKPFSKTAKLMASCWAELRPPQTWSLGWDSGAHNVKKRTDSIGFEAPFSWC